jgi:HSP20 family protein
MTTGTHMLPTKGLHALLPTDPFRLFPNRNNRLFEDAFNLFRPFAPFTEETLPLTTWTPLCDIYETEREIVLKMELPEVKKEDVRVTLENNVLTMRGERKFEERAEGENYHRVERQYGEFMRSFSLPTTVDPEGIKATYKDGVLAMTLPKRKDARPKQIEVKVT